MVLEILDGPGQTDGPTDKAKLCFPIIITFHGSGIYISEHSNSPEHCSGNTRNYDRTLFS